MATARQISLLTPPTCHGTTEEHGCCVEAVYGTYVDGLFNSSSSAIVTNNSGIKDIIMGLEYLTKLVAKAVIYDGFNLLLHEKRNRTGVFDSCCSRGKEVGGVLLRQMSSGRSG